MAPVDAIWLVLVKTSLCPLKIIDELVVPHHFVATHPPSHPIGVLLVLAMPVRTI